jgi:hypothetical protein
VRLFRNGNECRVVLSLALLLVFIGQPTSKSTLDGDWFRSNLSPLYFDGREVDISEQ